MSALPNDEIKLPIELLHSIFELASPEVLAVSARCNRRFYEICSPLLYSEVHLHTPTQLLGLSESHNIMRVLCSTGSLVIDDFILYQEAWNDTNAGGLPKPFQHLLHVLRASRSLHSLKVSHSYVPAEFHRRVDWECDHLSELLQTASDPEFLPSLTLISVFNPGQVEKSWFEELCYDRAIECYSTWSNTNKSLHTKIFPALERYGVAAPGPRLSPLATSRLASHPKRHIAAREIGRLVRRSIDFDNHPNITRLGLFLQFPGVTLQGEPSPIHNTFSWLKDVLSMAEYPQLQVLYVKFHSLPLDWAAGLDVQCLGLKDLQKAAPALVAVGMSSTGHFWQRYVPAPGTTPSYPTVPYWTPCPTMDPGTRIDVRALLVWWLGALGFDRSEMQNRDIMKNFVKQLRAAMYERWEVMAPAEDTLYDRLLTHF